MAIWARAITGRAREVPESLVRKALSVRGKGLEHTEQVDVLVDSIAGNGGEAKLLNEFTADVDDLALEGTNLQGLLAGSLEVLLLTDIGHL